jgi:hypothetical protein
MRAIKIIERNSVKHMEEKLFQEIAMLKELVKQKIKRINRIIQIY